MIAKRPDLQTSSLKVDTVSDVQRRHRRHGSRYSTGTESACTIMDDIGADVDSTDTGSHEPRLSGDLVSWHHPSPLTSHSSTIPESKRIAKYKVQAASDRFPPGAVEIKAGSGPLDMCSGMMPQTGGPTPPSESRLQSGGRDRWDASSAWAESDLAGPEGSEDRNWVDADKGE